MWKAKIVLRQLQGCLRRGEFAALVRQHGGDRHVHVVDCWSHFVCLIWAQLTGQSSLRDIEEHAEAQADVLRAWGVRSARRSTVSRANRKRPWQVMAEACAQMQHRCMALRTSRTVELPRYLYSLDTTVIDLCQAVFPWALFRKHKSGIKLHVLWDHRHDLPTLLAVTAGREREFRTARGIHLPHGSILCCDAGYLDFAWFEELLRRGITVITHPRVTWTYAVVERRPCDRRAGVRSDQVVRLTGPVSQRKYPGRLRRVRFVDPSDHSEWLVMTTNLDLPATTVVALYRRRWDIEEFFRWIKRNLKIRAFWGTSYNAVMWQLFAALFLYLLLAYLKAKMHLTWSLFQIQRKLTAYLYTEIPLYQLLAVQSLSAT